MKMRITLQRKAELTADNLLEAWSEGVEGLIILARKQIISELLKDKKRLNEEYGFFKEMSF